MTAVEWRQRKAEIIEWTQHYNNIVVGTLYGFKYSLTLIVIEKFCLKKFFFYKMSLTQAYISARWYLKTVAQNSYFSSWDESSLETNKKRDQLVWLFYLCYLNL